MYNVAEYSILSYHTSKGYKYIFTSKHKLLY